MAELDVISRNVLEGTEEYRDGRDGNHLSPKNQERWSPKGDATSLSSLTTCGFSSGYYVSCSYVAPCARTEADGA